MPYSSGTGRKVDDARLVASAFSDAKGRFRRLRGHRDMKTLLAALNAKSTSVTDAERKAA